MSPELQEFLYQSIEDSRSIIRAADIKVGFLFVVISQPLLHVASIASEVKTLCTGSLGWPIVFIIFAFFWSLSLFFLLRSVISTSKVAKQITGETPDDIFYDARLFDLNFLDLFLTRTGRSRLSFEQQVERVRGGEQTILQILTFEKMKLAYIRDVKIKLITACIGTMSIWLVLGMAISLYCVAIV